MSARQPCIPGPSFWPGRRQHQTPHEGRADERDLLPDEAADREAEHVHLKELERGQEGNHCRAASPIVGPKAPLDEPDSRRG
jgi:hypothetical protein